jgi:hypothetical protein
MHVLVQGDRYAAPERALNDEIEGAQPSAGASRSPRPRLDTAKENPGGGTPGFRNWAIGVGGFSICPRPSNSIDQRTSRLNFNQATRGALKPGW